VNAQITVTDREEAAQIRRALEDPEIRAMVRVAGVLLDLPTDRARRRVLVYVEDALDEAREVDVTVPRKAEPKKVDARKGGAEG
jgi:hypothetical protein